MSFVDLSSFDNSWYNSGGSFLKRLLWLIIEALFLLNPLNPSISLKIFWLRIFGAKIGEGVILKPAIHIKYPWHLTIGDHAWVGERVWIDNLVPVHIGAHVCLSQGAMLLTGNHDYKSPSFDLITGEITLEPGSWIGARATVCPGVTVGSHAILTVQSVATQDLQPYTIYQGNPAQPIRQRSLKY